MSFFLCVECEATVFFSPEESYYSKQSVPAGAEVRLRSGCTAYTLHRVIQPWMNLLKRKPSPLSRARCNRCKFIKIKVLRWHPASSLFRRNTGNTVSVLELWDQPYFSGRSETRRQGRWHLLKGRVLTWESERGPGFDRITSAIVEGTKRWEKRHAQLCDCSRKVNWEVYAYVFRT